MSDFDPRALWSLSYGIYVVTSRHQGKANGQVANTVIQVTAEPPRIAVAINKENYTHELISGSGVFAVAVLGESAPLNFIGHFGFNTGREMDKLSGIAADEGVTGCPVLTENAVSVFEARVFEKVDVGTHTLFIADVVSGRVLTDGKPMTYAQYHARKGKAPRKAPTYRPPETEKEEKAKGETSMKKYVCDVCGYEYDPADGDPESDIKPGTAFENLPEEWVCPVCGAGKEDFSPED